MLKTILFDLDGTLLPMDVEEFTQKYFGFMQTTMMKNGYDAKQMMQGVIAGTKAMYKNQGKETNEVLFWEAFVQESGQTRETMEPVFTHFYENVFPLIGKDGEQNQPMIDAVKQLKEKGYTLILSTNPLFPRMAVEERLRWAGLSEEYFSYITSYENSCACKPNLMYYKEILQHTNTNVEECMMVGNDTLEDGVVEQLGIPLYIVEDYMIHREEGEIQSKWHSNAEAFLAFVNELTEVK